MPNDNYRLKYNLLESSKFIQGYFKTHRRDFQSPQTLSEIDNLTNLTSWVKLAVFLQIWYCQGLILKRTMFTGSYHRPTMWIKSYWCKPVDPLWTSRGPFRNKNCSIIPLFWWICPVIEGCLDCEQTRDQYQERSVIGHCYHGYHYQCRHLSPWNHISTAG